MLPALLAQIGLPLLVRTVSGALERVNHPLAATASVALKEVEGAVADRRIDPAAIAEANRHIEAMAALDADVERTTLTEVNRSLRAEAASDDPYVRRMRPTFGYVMAATWCAQMGAIAWVIVTDPGAAGAVVEAMANLGMIWTVGLSVLGIYVYKRSEEKSLHAGGLPQPGLTSRLATALGARG